MVTSIQPSLYTSSPLLPSTERSSISQLLNSAHQVIKLFEEHLWKSIKKTSKVLKSVIKVLVLINSKIGQRIKHLINYLGLLTGIKLILYAKNCIKKASQLKQSIFDKDTEGIIVNSISLLFSPSQILSSFLCLSDTLHQLNWIPFLPFFSLLTVPVTFTVLTYSLIKNIYHLVTHILFLLSLPKKVTKRNLIEIKQFCTEKTQQTQIEISVRHTDGKIVNIMKNMKDCLTRYPENCKVLNLALTDLRKITMRKIALYSISILATIAETIMTIFLTIFSLSPIISSVSSLTKSMFSVIQNSYKNHWIYTKLELPEYLETKCYT